MVTGVFIFCVFLLIALRARFSTRKYFALKKLIDLGRILASLSFWCFTLLGATSSGIKLRWWIDSERSEEVVSRARVVQAIKEAFDANDIDPTDPQLIYYHEAKDGEEF